MVTFCKSIPGQYLDYTVQFAMSFWSLQLCPMFPKSTALTASYKLHQILNLRLIKTLFLSTDTRAKLHPPLSQIFLTHSFHTVSCFHAHLEAHPRCLNSLNYITCGGSRGVMSLHPASKSPVEVKHNTCNFQLTAWVSPQHPSFAPAICQWPPLISLRSPEDQANRPLYQKQAHKSSQKHTVQ